MRELASKNRLRAVSIPEERENRTRFLVLGLGEAPRGRRHKTSILFALKDRPGALHDALMPFKGHRINLTKIESRPSKEELGIYIFLVDLEGHRSEPVVAEALAAVRQKAFFFKVFGSYPRYQDA